MFLSTWFIAICLHSSSLLSIAESSSAFALPNCAFDTPNSKKSTLRARSELKLSDNFHDKHSKADNVTSQSWRDLEMRFRLVEAVQKNIEECNIDYSNSSPDLTCSEPCKACHMRGYKMCRFCRGTKVLIIGGKVVDKFSKCPVCQGTGKEICKNCAGTGYIASWTNIRNVKV
mmetsp:Transcript_10571/g.23300  ORF Transcript_10571/g.23300 Transcript_10571/m.23300 type:complete len:173 (-) Transcript_10571:331-849(-)